MGLFIWYYQTMFGEFNICIEKRNSHLEGSPSHCEWLIPGTWEELNGFRSLLGA
jgi:hypothetical protein